jgi:phosphatidylserine/phosphatidylglycerophosphate/cardiolipin synthase-like enzyme
MYILTLKGAQSEGAFAVETKTGEKVLQLFEDIDDAERYIILLEADNFPQLETFEIEHDQAIEACERFGYNYVIITPEDFVVPPVNPDYDFI